MLLAFNFLFLHLTENAGFWKKCFGVKCVATPCCRWRFWRGGGFSPWSVTKSARDPIKLFHRTTRLVYRVDGARLVALVYILLVEGPIRRKSGTLILLGTRPSPAVIGRASTLGAYLAPFSPQQWRPIILQRHTGTPSLILMLTWPWTAMEVSSAKSMSHNFDFRDPTTAANGKTLSMNGTWIT